jgi:hypothetical protein
MAIPSKQIGWGTEENLLWQISKQLENLTNVTYSSGSSSTTYVPYTGAISNVNLGGYNISANAFINGFSSITASGTQVVLTVNSAPEILVSGSGGQTIKLPDATTLANGTTFTFNNNQSSGAISVNNNSNTLVLSIPSGGYAEIMLLSNSTAAGSWDKHFQAPSNVSWSTNTLDYPGSITSATWNGNVIQPNRGGTGQSTYTDGQLLIGNTTGNTLSKSTLTPGTGITIVNGNGTITITATGAVSGAVTGSGTTNYVPKFTSSTVVGNSNIQDSGSLITLGSNTTISSGGLGIGSTNLTAINLNISKSITGGTTAFGFVQGGTVQSDVTTQAFGILNQLSTQATTFTIAAYVHFQAAQGTIGSGSSITSQYGFITNSNLTSATNNYGFYGDIPTGSNRWNLYMNGTAKNYLNGSLLIGSTTDAGYKLDVTGTSRFQGDTNISSGGLGIGTISSFDGNLKITKDLTGSGGNPNGIYQQSTILSDVTGGVILNRTSVSTQAASFTVANINHYFASQGTIGSGSSVTIQYGFNVSSNLIGATTNVGFVGQIPSGTNNWNLYMNGTANNYMAGNLGIGTTTLGGLYGYLNLGKPFTGGTNQVGYLITSVAQSDVTNSAVGYQTSLGTQATTFTLNDLRHFQASQGTIGSGSTITNQYGFWVGVLTGATNNYGFYGNILSGTNRWNLYMAGTAQNYLAGALSIGVTTANASALLQVDSTTQGVLFPRMTTTQKNAISSPATGLVVFDTTLGKLCVFSTTWQTITSS